MEEWRTIKDYPLYEVSNYGNVRSKPRTDSMGRKKEGQILKQSFDVSRHYLHVSLYNNSKQIVKNVHRLVADAFLDNPNGYKEVNHKDENKTNNSVDNLEWCTHKYNNNYGSRVGNVKGIRNPMNKIPPESVDFIKMNHRYRGGTMRTKELACMFNISQSHVSSIAHGRRWNYDTSNRQS